MNNNILNIGQKLKVTQDIDLNGIVRNTTLKKGTVMYAGADGLFHLPNETIVPITDEFQVEGYSIKGLSDYIMNRLMNNGIIHEIEIDCPEIREEIKESIANSLEELGFYNHEGNTN